jgi:hypothetical protein
MVRRGGEALRLVGGNPKSGAALHWQVEDTALHVRPSSHVNVSVPVCPHSTHTPDPEHTCVGDGQVPAASTPASTEQVQAALPLAGHELVELAQDPAGVPEEQEKHSVARATPPGSQTVQSDTHCPFELSMVVL